MTIKDTNNNQINTISSIIDAPVELPTVNLEVDLVQVESQPVKKKNRRKLILETLVNGQDNPPPHDSFVLPKYAHAETTPKKSKAASKKALKNPADLTSVDFVIPKKTNPRIQNPKQIVEETSKDFFSSPDSFAVNNTINSAQHIQSKSIANLNKNINKDINTIFQHAAGVLKTTQHSRFKKWLTRLLSRSNTSDRDLAVSCANSLLLSSRIKSKDSEAVTIAQLQNLADTYKRASFLSFKIKRTCLNTIDSTLKILLSNLKNNSHSLSILASVYGNLPAKSKFTIRTLRAIYKNLDLLSIEKQVEFIYAIIKDEENQKLYYPYTQVIINQIINNMNSPHRSLKNLQSHIEKFFNSIKERNERINNTNKPSILKRKIDEPVLEAIEGNIKVKLATDNYGYSPSAKNKHYRASSLPPKKAEAQAIGSIRGHYIYLGRKDGEEGFVGGVEPGFVGIRMNYAEFEGLFESIIQEQIAANNPSIIERENAYQQQLKATNRIEFFLGKRDQCRKTILEAFSKYGHPIKMVKLDFLDGKKVTISDSAAAKAGAIKRMAGNSRLLRSLFSIAYRFLRRTSSTQQSLNAFKEYFVTQHIAGNILGDRVQHAELEPRWNEVSPGVYQREYAISVDMNSNFKDFTKEFVDPDKDSNGQRVKIDAAGNFIKDSNGNYIAVETKGLGETFALQTILGNFDAFGSSGGNGGYDDKGYFTIDIGHAFEKNKNKLLDSVTPYLLAPSNKQNAKNFSLFHNTSLVDRIKGLLLLHRAFTGETLSDSIIQSYGPEFAKKYYQVKPVTEVFKKHIAKFKTEKNGNKYLDILLIMQKRWTQDAQKLLMIGNHYLDVTAAEVNFIDALAKLTSDVSNFNHDKSRQRIQLNHLRFDTEKGEPTVWKKYSAQNGLLTFEATNKNKTAAQIKKDIEEFAAHLNIKAPTMKIVHGHLTIAIPKADFNKYCQVFTEQNVAQWRNRPLAPSTLAQPINEATEEKVQVAVVDKTETVTQTNFASPLSSGKTLLERMSPEQAATIPYATAVAPHKLSPLLQELIARFESNGDKFDFNNHVTLHR